MEIKKIDISQHTHAHYRPSWFDDFIWQEDIKKVLKTAIDSSKKTTKPIWHILFLGQAGYGKTTLAQIVANDINKGIKIVTWYALSKPADLISILNTLSDGDIFFIDEIHRLAPKIEEMLYTAMEDHVIDMVMPDGGSLRLPIQPFTLIGATTKSDHLSKPLKSRFVYKFHFIDYDEDEKKKIIWYYLNRLWLKGDNITINQLHHIIDSIPREIQNMCVRVYDYVISKKLDKNLQTQDVEDFIIRNKVEKWGITPIQKKYLDILSSHQKPVWLKTIAIKMWLDEKSIEEDIEPLLIKLGKIEKTLHGRVLWS